MHKKYVFNNIPNQTFIFVAQDIHVQKHVLLNTNDKLCQFKRVDCIMNYYLKKNMLGELYGDNYMTSNNLVNNADNIFQDYT
jgi:hypothetical protein